MMVMCLVGENVYEEIFIFTSDGISGSPGCRNHPRKKRKRTVWSVLNKDTLLKTEIHHSYLWYKPKN